MGVFGRREGVYRFDLAEEPEFEVGGLVVKPADLTVCMNGERRDLQPRVMKVLCALAKARPGVVSRHRLGELCWDGRIVGDDALNRCVLALRHLAQEFTPTPFTIETVPRVGHRLVECSEATDETSGAVTELAPETGAGTSRVRRRQSMLPIVAGLSALAVLVLVAVLLSRAESWPWGAGSRPTTVLVTTGRDDGASQALAHDLAMKLASLESARSESMQLINHAVRSPGHRDLILEVQRIADPAMVGATLTLSAAPDRAILWSEEFQQPSRNLADLKQQIAFTAARVLGCAAEGLDAKPARLSQQTLKLYLNGCAALADLHGREAESVIPIFTKVVRDAPRFEAAWEKLLVADTEVVQHTEAVHDANRLRMHLAAAKGVIPNSAAVYLAELTLLPYQAFSERVRLAHRGVELNPSNALAYTTRAQVLQLVGRMKDAVVDARRAMQLEPLFPAARSTYIMALANAGLYEVALQELEAAERLWPGTSSVAATRFAFNLRYGDPRQAWAYLRAEPSADWMNARSYLQARLDPTPAKIERAIRDAEKLYRSSPRTIGHLIQVYGEFDREKDLLELLLRVPQHYVGYVDLTFRPPVVDFWDDPRALLVAKRAGLLDYWRTSGHWPDFCLAPDLPYDCKAEAAKLQPR